MVKEIYLAKNKGIALVDDENYELLNQYKWYVSNKYAYSTIKINGKWINKSMHRFIMNEPLNMEIDHIDMNRLNNQKDNLRIVTKSQNNMNRGSYKNSSSIFKGVSWNKQHKKWCAEIRKNGIKIHLGYFINELKAAEAYNEKAIKLFGEYINLNIVDYEEIR